MKKLFLFIVMLSVVVLVSLSNQAFAQSPQSFKYQTVVRNNEGKALANTMIGLRISILFSSPQGNAVYVETFQHATNEFGIASINIGKGTATQGVFAAINWAAGEYFIKTEVDITGATNYEFIGTSQLLSVPYALYAEKAGKSLNDQDTSATNELQNITKTGNTVTLSQNGGNFDLSEYLDNTDNQTLSLTDPTHLTISNGNTIQLSAGLADLDADSTNEIQSLTLNSDTLKLSKANHVVFSHDADRDSTNEIQQFQLTHNTLHLTKANTIIIDADTTNEIQSLFFSNDTVYISKSNNVTLPYIPIQNQGIPVGFDTVCNLQNEGKLRYNSIAKNMQFCNGTDWVVLNYTLTDTLIVNTSFSHVTAIGFNNGVISINITGGLLPYAINWNNGSHATLLNNLSAGTYIVTVTDANLTTVIKSIPIYEPLPVTDVDGNIYNSVTIGTQIWMRENLKTTKYRNNTPIPNVTNHSSWVALSTGARCYFDNDSVTNAPAYGALYNWYAVNDANGLCPTGWHVPSDAEWTILTDYLGGESIAGDKLKEAGTVHWSYPNSGATNSSNFTALPGGERDHSGSFGYIYNMGYWWSSTAYDTEYVWERYLMSSSTGVTRDKTHKGSGFSLRCIKD